MDDRQHAPVGSGLPEGFRNLVNDSSTAVHQAEGGVEGGCDEAVELLSRLHELLPHVSQHIYPRAMHLQVDGVLASLKNGHAKDAAEAFDVMFSDLMRYRSNDS